MASFAKNLITSKRACKVLGCGIEQLYALMNTGVIREYKAGDSVKYCLNEINRYLDEKDRLSDETPFRTYKKAKPAIKRNGKTFYSMATAASLCDRQVGTITTWIKENKNLEIHNMEGFYYLSQVALDFVKKQSADRPRHGSRSDPKTKIKTKVKYDGDNKVPVDEAAIILGVSAATIYNWVNVGKLKNRGTGGKFRFNLDEINLLAEPDKPDKPSPPSKKRTGIQKMKVINQNGSNFYPISYVADTCKRQHSSIHNWVSKGKHNIKKYDIQGHLYVDESGFDTLKKLSEDRPRGRGQGRVLASKPIYEDHEIDKEEAPEAPPEVKETSEVKIKEVKTVEKVAVVIEKPAVIDAQVQDLHTEAVLAALKHADPEITKMALAALKK